MDHNTLSWYETMLLWGTLIAAWVFGEGGKVVIAGAVGGFIRWMMEETRRVRDGAIAVTTGGMFATYLTPVGIAMLNKWFGPLEDSADEIKFSAAFAMGIGGMTVAKLITALFEAYARKVKSEGNK